MKRTLVVLILLGAVSTALGRTPRPDGDRRTPSRTMKDAGHDTKPSREEDRERRREDNQEGRARNDTGCEKDGNCDGDTTKKGTHETTQAAKKTGSAVGEHNQEGRACLFARSGEGVGKG